MNCYKTDDNILQNGSSRLFSFVIISLEFTDAQHTHTTVNKCVMMQKWKENKKKIENLNVNERTCITLVLYIDKYNDGHEE